MADTSHVVCPVLAASGGGHCWHIRWVPVARETTMVSDGKVCCWCGERAPLTAEYVPPVEHGPHRQSEPYSLAPRGVPFECHTQESSQEKP